MKSRSAVDAAVECLRAELLKDTWSRTGRLPGLKALALLTGVSLVTVWKAVKCLEREGMVTVIRGQGIRLPWRQERNIMPPENPPSVWERTRTRILTDINNGIFALGKPLPSNKLLSRQYRVHTVTLRKALSALCEDGTLSPWHRGYMVAPLNTVKAQARIAVLGWGDPPDFLSPLTPWGAEYYQMLERECARINLAIEYLSFHLRDGNVEYTGKDGRKDSRLREDGSIIGYIVRTLSLENAYVTVLRELARQKKPVAILDEGSGIDLPQPCRLPAFRTFSVSVTTMAGRQVGRFLRSRSHRHVAFFSPFHGTHWSRSRLEGLREAFCGNGKDGRVTACTAGHTWSDEYLSIVKPSVTGAILQPGAGHALAANVAEDIRSVARDAVIAEVIRLMIKPCFDRVFDDRTVTAWVCANDMVASLAADFLRSSHTRRIELISFDDTFQAFDHSVTSFNFNIPAVIHAMLGHVLRSDTRRRHMQPPLEIEGFIVQRSAAP